MSFATNTQNQDEGHPEALPQKLILKVFLCTKKIRVRITAGRDNHLFYSASLLSKGLDALNRYLGLGRRSGHTFAAGPTK